MTWQPQLIGYADTVGKGVGFLVPVFNQRGSNAPLVQRVSSNGTILEFESVDNIEARIVYVDRVPAAEGEEAIWAFAFSEDDIVSGRGTEFRKLLTARIDDPALAERPLLSIEVAEFLNMPERRLKSAKAALARLSELSGTAAKTWMDLSILTPDLRRALARAGRHYAAAVRRLVATVHGDEILVQGVALEADGSIVEEIKRVTHNVMRDLITLYPLPREGWKVRTVRSNSERRTATAEAIVWLADRRDAGAQPYLQDDFSWRIDAYRADELEDFRAATLSFGTPAFVVARGERERMIKEIESLAGGRIAGIQFGSQRRLKLFADENLFVGLRTPLRIYVPATGFPSAPISNSATGKIIRQVVAATLAVGGARGQFELEGRWLFYRTVGTGADPSADAWATLYDRAFASGLSTEKVYSLAGRERPSRYDDRYPGWAREVLFPNARALEDRRIDLAMHHGRSDAAILLPVTQRNDDDWRAHTGSIKRVLSQQGWNPREVTREREWTLEVEGRSNLRFVRLGSKPMANRPSWDLSEMLHGNLDSINAVTVTGDAGASNILARLHQCSELTVSVRDLCGSEARNGIWSILATQLRRLASGQMTRGRSHFMALLIDNAFQQNHIDFEEAGSLYDAIHGPTLGDEVQLTWSRVRQTPEETRASVRLLAGVSNQYLKGGVDLIQPFSIVVHSDGTFVFRDHKS